MARLLQRPVTMQFALHRDAGCTYPALAFRVFVFWGWLGRGRVRERGRESTVKGEETMKTGGWRSAIRRYLQPKWQSRDKSDTVAWNGRQLINHPAELDIAHVRADAMNAPACTSRPFHPHGHVSAAPTHCARARAQFCRSSSPLFLASCSPYPRSIPRRPSSLVHPVSSLSSVDRMCPPSLLFTGHSRSSPIGFAYRHSCSYTLPLPLPPFHPRMHPTSSADCESPSRCTRAVPSIVSIEGGHDGINYNA